MVDGSPFPWFMDLPFQIFQDNVSSRVGLIPHTCSVTSLPFGTMQHNIILNARSLMILACAAKLLKLTMCQHAFCRFKPYMSCEIVGAVRCEFQYAATGVTCQITSWMQYKHWVGNAQPYLTTLMRFSVSTGTQQSTWT